MIRWKNPLFNFTVAVNCLLCFLLLFDSRLVVPAWLQVAGRMHPLILHFPIALLVVFAFQRFVLRHQDNTLLLLAALSAAITAVMGLFLSKEPGYDADVLFWHKYSGVALSFLTCCWYAWYDRLEHVRFAPASTAVGCLVLLTFTGHEGAGITHGRNFLLAPVSPQTPAKKVALEDAVVFNDMVRPILQTKCIGCHNSSKAKGELIMETAQLLLKGGKDGPLWDSTEADFGLMMRRIHLPPDDDKHMPPKGKPQLTDAEIAILWQWLKHDPTRTIRVAQLPPSDTLRQLALPLLASGQQQEQFDFPSADEATVRRLNNSYRVIYPVALNSPALDVDFYSPQFFQPAQLKELEPISRQIVSLDLDKMPVTDADMPDIVRCENLRTLNLDFTGVTGAGVAQLCRLEKLKSLSLSGTAIKPEDINCLMTMKSLRHLYVWNTAIPAGSIVHGNANSGLTVETGLRTDTMVLRLNPPILQTEERVLKQPVRLRLKHYVPGVAIRYTLNGTEPDSSSPVYTGNTMLTENAILTARAFKKGWLPSDSVRARFYSERNRPDSIRMLQPIDSQYMKFGARTLTDLEKGDDNYGSGKWLGFVKNKMECMLYFTKPVTVRGITLSSLVNTYAYIFAPFNIEVWGGTREHNLRLLGHLSPEQPRTPSAFQVGYDVQFAPVKVGCLRIVATPVKKMPDWHPGKGKPAWEFFDEIFVN
ncbi:MAG TPA: chitobiase/beta-hexosaminidase C-terminal domain-containing protein [Puia sp.]|nr:chitobiase/beta-hexosaminidase C-terminal domain-containing protein [Puia sp.]